MKNVKKYKYNMFNEHKVENFTRHNNRNVS